MVKGIIPIIAQKENLDFKKNMIYLQSDIDMSQQSVCFRNSIQVSDIQLACVDKCLTHVPVINDLTEIFLTKMFRN